MRIYILLIALLVSVSCRPKSVGISTKPNQILSIKSQNVENDGLTWVELTISNRVNPEAPSYIVGIRSNPKTDDLRWAVIDQELGQEIVVTRIRVRPVDPTHSVTLDRDDFEWLPNVHGFEPVIISIKK